MGRRDAHRRAVIDGGGRAVLEDTNTLCHGRLGQAERIVERVQVAPVRVIEPAVVGVAGHEFRHCASLDNPHALASLQQRQHDQKQRRRQAKAEAALDRLHPPCPASPACATTAGLIAVKVLQRLPKIVPPAVARQMAYTGERVGAERAFEVGDGEFGGREGVTVTGTLVISRF